MTDFFEIRVENLEFNKETKKSSAAVKKFKKKIKKRKQEDSDSSFVESSEESTQARCPSKKYCIEHGQCSHSMDSCKYLFTIDNKYKQKKKNFKTYGKSNKELNVLIKKKFQQFVKKKKGGR